MSSWWCFLVVVCFAVSLAKETEHKVVEDEKIVEHHEHLSSNGGTISNDYPHISSIDDKNAFLSKAISSSSTAATTTLKEEDNKLSVTETPHSAETFTGKSDLKKDQKKKNKAIPKKKDKNLEDLSVNAEVKSMETTDEGVGGDTEPSGTINVSPETTESYPETTIVTQYVPVREMVKPEGTLITDQADTMGSMENDKQPSTIDSEISETTTPASSFPTDTTMGESTSSGGMSTLIPTKLIVEEHRTVDSSTETTSGMTDMPEKTTTDEGSTDGTVDTADNLDDTTDSGLVDTTTMSHVIESTSTNRQPKQMHFDHHHTRSDSNCSCDMSKMPLEPSSCKGERTVPDPGCPCRQVCARQVNEPCSGMEPCDVEFGLQCNLQNGTCQGQLSFEVFDVTHNAAKVKWNSENFELLPQASISYSSLFRGTHTQWIKVEDVKSITLLENLLPGKNYYLKIEEDGKQQISTFKTKEGCIYNGTLSYGVGERFNLSCSQTCVCFSNGAPECHDRCYYKPAEVLHPSCIEIPDETDPCCVRLHCKDNVVGSMPKILVKQRSQTTLTVVWDDFRLPSYHSEYILEYRPSGIDNQNWTKVQAGTQTIVTVTHLSPNTPYEIKVAVWEDEKLELPSEMITAYTSDGCVRENRMYSTGEEFFHECDFRCTCSGNNESDCSPRCNEPYVKVGSKSEDPLCYEKPLSSDPCCVMIRCTESKALEENSEKVKTGECPAPLEESESASKLCLSDCDHDGDCSGDLKCCSSSCGGAICVQPLHAKDVCENVYCGPNAECKTEKKACECLEGYVGNPHDFLNGCVLGNETEATQNKSMTSDSSFELDFGDKGQREPKHESQTTSPKPHHSSEVSKNELETNKEIKESVPSTEAPFQLDLTSHTDKTNSTVIDDIKSLKQNATEIPNDEENFHLRRPQDKLESESSSEAPEENGSEDEKMPKEEKDESSDMPMLFGGCEYNNITYDRGVRFEDGCEARCICDGPGHVSCVPRCTLLASGGPACHEVPDPDDACCKIMICNFPGSENSDDVDGLPLKIISAMAQNGTSVRIRLAISMSHLPTMVGRENLEVWFKETDNSDNNLSQWNKNPVTQKDLTEIQQGIFEFDIYNLVPETDYYIKVAKENHGAPKLDMAEFSNTVNVKTFPAAVKAVFEACFHHNQSYGLGEVFYQGCEYKCICREKGFIECQDRCEIYIDTVGFEGCEWVPSEEDSCCTVPSCQRRKIPLMPLPDGRPPFIGGTDNMCVVSTDEVYRVGDIWESGDGCKMKICRCTLLVNGSTSIQCQSECPPLPPNAHIPTARCPHPVLIKPDGPCSCPYVGCNDTPRRIVQPPRPQCEYKGHRYDMGQEFHDGCIALCHCGQDLRVNCAAVECPYHFSAEFTNCLEWDIDPDFFPSPPHCCAPAKCKNDGSCAFSGRKFENFEDIPSEILPCGARCVCVNGNVTCENRCPPIEDVPPVSLPCAPNNAFKGNPEGDTCCLQWMCKEPVKQAYCNFQGSRYLVSEQWEVRKGSQHRACTCQLNAIGAPEVECKGGCPQIPQRFLLPTEQCLRPVIVTPEDPVMCPYVVCNNTLSAGQELYNVNVVAMNSTAVRIRFSLSNILVGLIGHAELHFTTDPTLPPTQWHIQKFSRPKRLFDSPNIEYILNALRPNTTYFLQVKIKIDALQGGPESELFKLRMPEEIIPTTTTTTMPPMIMIDAKPEAFVIDDNTIRISWRNFEPQEKKFIYALQLKYKLESDAEDKWITTPMIHRDVTSYFLHDLEPTSTYSVDMIFTSPKDMNTKLISAKPLQIHTSGKIKEDYHLHVSVENQKISPESSEFTFEGIPEPISKYVHVVKVLYKTPDGKEKNTFKVPKSNHISLEDLKPGIKYLAQLELYLTNGQTLMSNEVEFITKPAKPGTKVSGEENTISDSGRTNGKQAELLQSKDSGGEDENRAYFIALVVVAVVAAVAAFGFVLLLVILVRRQASAKAPISRTPSESAYDNPTYKTYDGERPEDKTNGSAIQTTQA